MTIDKNECFALYAFLKKREEILEPVLETLLRRIETLVFDTLSIEEAEKLVSAQGEETGGGKL